MPALVRARMKGSALQVGTFYNWPDYSTWCETNDAQICQAFGKCSTSDSVVAAFMALQPFSVLRISAGLGKRQQRQKLNNGGRCDFQTGVLPDWQPWKGCR